MKKTMRTIAFAPLALMVAASLSHGAGEYIAVAKLSDMQNKHYSTLVLISREKVKEWTKLTKFRYFLFKRENWVKNLENKSTEYELSRILTDASFSTIETPKKSNP